MRKRRAVVFEDDIVIMGLLKMFLGLRGYSILAYDIPMTCPVKADGDSCDMIYPCADIELVDYNLEGMNGVDLIRDQMRRKCKLDSKNRALLVGYFDTVNKTDILSLGCALFEKPLNFTELAKWFDECETRINLSHPLGNIRREQRFACNKAVAFHTFQTVGLRKGMVLNSSPSGLCLQTTSPLRVHQTLTIRSFDSPLSQSALVCWSKPVGDTSYLAGLQFQSSGEEDFTRELQA
ncbi:MAG TPA: hypothetical protein VK654_10390 [Nitrospirota bacterium]|nr:hypothetical protein [Nitrospirota bacterium]